MPHSAHQCEFIKLVQALFFSVSHFSQSFLNLSKQEIIPPHAVLCSEHSRQSEHICHKTNLPKYQNHFKSKLIFCYLCYYYLLYLQVLSFITQNMGKLSSAFLVIVTNSLILEIVKLLLLLSSIKDLLLQYLHSHLQNCSPSQK